MKIKPLGFLSPSSILVGLLTLFVTAGFVLFNQGDLFTAGELNARVGENIGGVHSHAEIGNDCARCHSSPWGVDTMDDRCKTCHTDITTQLADQTSEHGEMMNGTFLTCRDCHPEHKGRNSLLTFIKTGSFPHNATGYSLASHKLRSDALAFTCSDCHGKDITRFDLAVCSTCHQQIDGVFLNSHIQAYGSDCLECHDGVETISKNFDHSQAVFKLEGKHSGLVCEKCHFNAHIASDFKSISTNCSNCHQKDDVHKGQLGNECGTCHVPAAWKPSTYDHNLSPFKLTEAHATVPCANCHVNGVFKGIQSTCYACHQKDDFHNASLGQSCDGCHTTRAWKPATFDHNFSVFKLTGSHVDVACANCHINNVFKGIPSTCFECHQKKDIHNRKLGQNCGTCHTTQAWKPATFDHNLSAFNLTGAHVNVICEKCHINNVLTGTPSSCTACHQKDDKHAGRFGPNCISCHTTQAWKPAAFNHNLSFFKLSGAHTRVACARCHVNNKFQGTPSTCYACHQKNDNHNGRLGQNCSSCHTTQTWAGASFDHNLAAFQLIGAHASVACANCHVNNKFSGTPSTCYGCHQKNDIHNGSLGQDCSSCHTTQTWSGASFDHNLSAFKLTGNHVSVACANCHVNNVFKGIPSTCYACHQKNDIHNGNLGQDCNSCHTTQTWADASFDHNLSVFKLTGAHVTVLCTNCHINNIYNGTSQECSSCHGDPVYHAGIFPGQTCSTCHATSAWLPAAFSGFHTFPRDHGGNNSTCRNCHPSTLSNWTCYACHNQNEVTSKHLDRGITDLSNCMLCHPAGRKN